VANVTDADRGPERVWDLATWAAVRSRLQGGDSAAEADVVQHLLGLARRGHYRGYGRRLGSDACHDVVMDAIYGRKSKRRSGGEPAEEDGGGEETRWTKGLLTYLKDPEARLDNPEGWAVTSLTNALWNALQEQDRLDPEEVSDVAGTWVPIEKDVTAVPKDVARTFRDAARFVAVALQVAPRVGASHPLYALLDPETAAPLRRKATQWAESEGFLVRDISLGKGRLPWDRALKVTRDRRTRAWQAFYYISEGATDFARPDEIPEERTPRNLFDQDLKRFREPYWGAASVASAIVDKVAERPIIRTDGRAELPLEWEAAAHPTLGAAPRGGHGRTAVDGAPSPGSSPGPPREED